MTCALSAGYSAVDCRDGIGGTKEIYVIELKNVTFEETTGKITGVTNATGKRWWKYDLPKETANAKSTLNANVQNGTQSYNHEVSVVLNKMTSATRNELKNLVKNSLCVIVKHKTGTCWLYGRENGLDVTGGGSDSGTAPADRNGYTLTLTGNESEDAIEVDSTLIEDLETPGT